MSTNTPPGGQPPPLDPTSLEMVNRFNMRLANGAYQFTHGRIVSAYRRDDLTIVLVYAPMLPLSAFRGRQQVLDLATWVQLLAFTRAVGTA